MLKFGKIFISEDFLEGIGDDPHGSAVAYMKSGRVISLGVTMEEAEAVLDRAALITVLDDRYIPEFSISNEEMGKLQELWGHGFRYLARDDNTDFLYAYHARPAQRPKDWVPSIEEQPLRVKEEFSFVTFNGGPFSIWDALNLEVPEDD